MVSISGSLLNIVYDALFWEQNLCIGGKQQPLLIVLEEAHNYLKSGASNIASRYIISVRWNESNRILKILFGEDQLYILFLPFFLVPIKKGKTQYP